MYEKRKIRKIITHFEAIPLETGLFGHVLNLFKHHLQLGEVGGEGDLLSKVALFIYLFSLQGNPSIYHWVLHIQRH